MSPLWVTWEDNQVYPLFFLFSLQRFWDYVVGTFFFQEWGYPDLQALTCRREEPGFSFMLRKKAEYQTNSKMVRKYCFLNLTPDWSQVFCPVSVSQFLGMGNSNIWEQYRPLPFRSFHLYWVGHSVPLGKGICSISVPLGYPFSKRRDLAKRKWWTLSRLELYFWGSQQFSQLHCELCLGGHPWANVFLHFYLTPFFQDDQVPPAPHAISLWTLLISFPNERSELMIL